MTAIKRKLGSFCNIKYGKDHKALGDGEIPCFGSGGVMRHVEKAIHDQPSVLIPRKGTLGNLFYAEKPFWTVDTLFWTDINTDVIEPLYLFYALKTVDLAGLNVGTAVPSLTAKVLNEVEVPYCTINKQRQILRILKDLDQKITLNQQLNDYLAA